MNAYLKLDHIDKYFDKGGSRAEVLKGINLTIEKANSSPSSAIPAAASPPCSISSPD